jgi:uncharacterized integral membrane protein
MKIRTVFLLIGLIVIAVFAAINWGAFTTPTTLSLLFGVVQAPLGLVMLGLTALLTAVFLLFAVFLQTSALLDARRHERELQSMRELAEHAESSRFTKLHEFFKEETQKLAGMSKESRTEVLKRLDQIDKDVNSTIEQSSNSLAAYIGELEDKLEKMTNRSSLDTVNP